MNLKENWYAPQVIANALQPNDQMPYRRIIEAVHWVSPDKLPVVFHTTATGLDQISPVFCKSFDYKLFDQVIPITYVLPLPHVNRVRGRSEVWHPNKQEGYERSGISFTYIRIPKDGRIHGQIRMGSTMLDQYMLAARNNGWIFVVYVTEINQAGLRSQFREFISLADLPVIDGQQFHEPSPVGMGASGVETHLPDDICRPELVGCQPLLQYLEALRDPDQRIKITDIANTLIALHPDQLVHGVFRQLVAENRQALMHTATSNNRLLINFQ